MNTTVLVTGATGLLGTEIIKSLLTASECPIYALVRAKDREHALHRLSSYWWEEPLLISALEDRVKIVCGDITQDALGLSEEAADSLVSRIRCVIHTAAETGVQSSRTHLRRVNTDGTENVLSFARRIQKTGTLERFVYISTAYVAGDRQGLIMETDPLPSHYSTYYEESKADAERLVLASGLPYTICRPGMIIGNSQTGRTRNFNTIYYILKLMMQEKLPVLPISSSKKINVIPADHAARSVTRLMLHPKAQNAIFHIVTSEVSMPAAGELADYVCRWAQRELNIRLKKPLFIPAPALKHAGALHNRKVAEKQKRQLSNLLALTPYFYDDRVFDRTNAEKLLGREDPDWHSYIDVILDYACRCNFLHATDRNVFEQALFRMQSQTVPFHYYNVSETVTETSGVSMHRRILAIAAALTRLGVRKGSKVAITGNNCTNYFGLDMAIGLVGAVSVPIYYTTPVAEIDILLQKSGAEWFFVGDKRIMKQIDDLRGHVTLIAFSSALKIKPQSKKYMTWQQFLGSKELCKKAQYPDVLVDPGDLATIRYTSGTTGEPKGVMFNAGQLAWMGRVLTDLLPWREKQKEMRYLSFLPLSHVVEGILASYAPYYMHCPVKFYYLNDFDKLTEALPKVRPTVFFSVPRFYEKLWQQIEANPAGQKYLAMQDGPAKTLLGAIVRQTVLKKAGLDCCSQLIVGSAPISEDLLLKFRRLGIEIHNAYGQTEAPLITINRMGDNVIPSIGTPLPETEVTATPDGELIVKGPQVCLGYYGLETENIKDGVLSSGDLGTVGENGHIYLTGRKKEMLITSYGKNINCPKVEEKLKDIPGVSEAVLIGENRPYCTALLWTESDVPDLQAQIASMNRDLSHPEQIKKWKVIDTPLSIKAGELTPNLKVRRSVVEEHYKNEIEKFYKN